MDKNAGVLLLALGAAAAILLFLRRGETGIKVPDEVLTTGGYSVQGPAIYQGHVYDPVAFDKSICLNLRTMQNEDCSSMNTYYSKLAAGLMTGACIEGSPETCGQETYVQYIGRWPSAELVALGQQTQATNDRCTAGCLGILRPDQLPDWKWHPEWDTWGSTSWNQCQNACLEGSVMPI